MPSNTPDVHARLSAIVKADRRTGPEWALLLGLGIQSFHDRLKGRTRWTLCDAMTLAATIGVSLDTLVGDEDLPIGYDLGRHPAIARTGASHIDTMLDAEAVAADAARLHLVQDTEIAGGAK